MAVEKKKKNNKISRKDAEHAEKKDKNIFFNINHRVHRERLWILDIGYSMLVFEKIISSIKNRASGIFFLCVLSCARKACARKGSSGLNGFSVVAKFT